MWQAPNQRVRALASAKKRERERQRRPIHIRRVHAELKVMGTGLGKPQTICMARVLLNDLSCKGVGLFSPTFITPGQIVGITIEEPKRFYVKGRIAWCQENETQSHVLSQMPFTYRLGIEFLFQTKEEEAAVKAYVDELCREHLYSTKLAG